MQIRPNGPQGKAILNIGDKDNQTYEEYGIGQKEGKHFARRCQIIGKAA